MSITILYGTQTIGYSAFSYCSSLQSVALPGSVTSIGEFAFARCSSLSSITIPNSLTSLGNFVFMDCSGLTSIYCLAQQPPTLGIKVFEGVNKTIPLYVLENSVSLYSAADQWKDFTNINGIPNGLCGDSVNWAIQDSVFVISGTGSMTDYSYSNPAPWTAYQNVFNRVVIHEGVTTIGDWAFSTCSNILSVTLPNTLTSIGERAFAGCSGLTSLNIPESVESIGDRAFSKVLKAYRFLDSRQCHNYRKPHVRALFQSHVYHHSRGRCKHWRRGVLSLLRTDFYHCSRWRNNYWN